MEIFPSVNNNAVGKPMTIEQLIEGCKKQKRKYQKALYDRFHALAFNVGLRYAKDNPEAKDIVQNAFIKIFDKIDTYQPQKGAFEGWLTRIVINEALQQYRQNKGYLLNGEDSTHQMQKIMSSDPPVFDYLQAKDVLKLIHKLPIRYRLVFQMAVVEGYSHREIANLLEINESTSRSQLARAKSKLRVLLNEQKTMEYGQQST